MQSSATEYVIHGPESYIDYDKTARNRRQLLVSDQTANILSNFLAIFLALAAKNIYNVGRRILRVCNRPQEHKTQVLDPNLTGPGGSEDSHTEPTGSTHHSPAIRSPENAVTTGVRVSHIAPDTNPTAATPEDHVPDIETPSVPQGHYERRIHRLEVIEDSHDTEAMIANAFRHLLSWLQRIVPIRPLDDNTSIYRRMLTTRFWYDMYKIANESSGDLVWHLLVGVGALCLYFGMLLLGIMSAYPVVGDSVAVSRHPKCGIVILNDPQRVDAPYFALGKKYYNDIARESRQYAKSCYGLRDGASGARGPDSCSFFYEPNIKYSIIDNDTCPFRVGAGHLCLDGERSAYTLVTGSPNYILADASAIGINSPLRYKFHRSMTCSPLRMDGLIHPFVTEKGIIGFRYFYGNRTGDLGCTSDLPNCTFEVLVYPDLHRPYSMYTESTYPLLPRTWQLPFDVNETFGEVATLMLIANFGISYPSESLDPIFPANQTFDGKWYYNSQYHASVLGCMSRTVVCLVDTTPPSCYNLTGLGSLDSTEPEHGPVRVMLYFSLLSGLPEQVSYLEAEALDAQSLLSGSTSSEISGVQWKAEARQMFESVLARTQIMARNIARGFGEELSGQENLSPALRGMCTRYKFRSVGWKNISVSRFVGEFLAGLVVCILGITRENEELWVEQPVRRMVKSRLGRRCASGLTKLAELWIDYGPEAWKALCSLANGCWSLLCGVVRTCWHGTAASTGWVHRLWREQGPMSSRQGV